MKMRHNLYLDRPVGEALQAMAMTPGTSKSQIASDALADYFARRGRRDIDMLFKPRLDRLSREIARLNRDLTVLIEAFALFVRHQLILTAGAPEADAAVLALGREQFEAFIGQLGRQLGRQLAAGRTTFGPEQLADFGDADAEVAA